MRVAQATWLVVAAFLGIALDQLSNEGVPALPRQLPEAEQRGVNFLTREVPRWRRENGCYSCHNNGDAVRALSLAYDRRFDLAPTVLAETTSWLARPADWQHNGGEGPFNDPVLASLQFTLALDAAHEAGLLSSAEALEQAVDLLVRHQQTDGSWATSVDSVGSPCAYGTPLSTALARRVVQRAVRHQSALARLDAWLLALEPRNVVEAASLLLAWEQPRDPLALQRQRQALTLIQTSQSAGGGWGPYSQSPPEAFDTALVLLALVTHRSTACDAIRQRGRRFLIRQQQPDGSWPETTRPAQGDSYAQRLSTTAWAVLALLHTPPPVSSPAARKSAP